MKLKQKLAAATLAAGIGVGGGAIASWTPVEAAAEATPAVASVALARHGDACTNAPDSGPVWNFHDACHWHDWCYGAKPYGNSQWGRLQCDSRFWDRMISSCNNRYAWYNPARYACHDVARLYFGAVVAAGWYFWD